jgi:Tfp pilus assembly protein PilF
MKGAALRSRRTAPPHFAQVVRGAAEIRCFSSNILPHFRHSYSYVGTNVDTTWACRRVSRHRNPWRRWPALIFVLALCMGCASAAPSPPTDSRKLQARATYERGLAYLQDRQATLALGSLREAIALDGTVPAYHNTLGLLLLDTRQPDLAAESFQRAVSLDPAFADAHLNLGIALAEMARWQEAVLAYRQALSRPTLAAASITHQNLGLALFHLRQYPEAERELRLAITLDPRMEAAYYNLGLLFLATDRSTEARAAFLQVRALAPQSPFSQAASEQLRRLGDGG